MSKIAIRAGHADGSVIWWLAAGTHGVQRLRSMPCDCGPVRSLSLDAQGGLLVAVHRRAVVVRPAALEDASHASWSPDQTRLEARLPHQSALNCTIVGPAFRARFSYQSFCEHPVVMGPALGHASLTSLLCT